MIKKGKSTNRESCHLENIWTNIDHSVKLVENIPNITDHSIFQVTLRIGPEVKLYLPFKDHTFYFPTDVKKAISTNT